jgi:hypothetical protein
VYCLIDPRSSIPMPQYQRQIEAIKSIGERHGKNVVFHDQLDGTFPDDATDIIQVDLAASHNGTKFLLVVGNTDAILRDLVIGDRSLDALVPGADVKLDDLNRVCEVRGLSVQYFKALLARLKVNGVRVISGNIPNIADLVKKASESDFNYS